MKIIRVTASAQDDRGELDENNKLVLVCGVDQANLIASGEWLGYIQDETIFHPFILKDESSMFYGGEGHYSEKINIGHEPIEVGRLITISSSEDIDNKPWAEKYTIIDCHTYQD